MEDPFGVLLAPVGGVYAPYGGVVLIRIGHFNSTPLGGWIKMFYASVGGVNAPYGGVYAPFGGVNYIYYAPYGGVARTRTWDVRTRVRPFGPHYSPVVPVVRPLRGRAQIFGEISNIRVCWSGKKLRANFREIPEIGQLCSKSIGKFSIKYVRMGYGQAKHFLDFQYQGS